MMNSKSLEQLQYEAPLRSASGQNIKFPFALVLAIFVAIFVFVSVASAEPQSSSDANAAGISASDIVAKMNAMNQARAAALKTFTSQRTYELDYSGFPSHKHAKMVVDAQFTRPHDKQLRIVSEEGSELLRNHVLRKLVETELEASNRENQAATALNETNYEFTLLGKEQKDGRSCYALEVKPRTKSKFLYEGRVWIDSDEFAVVHIQARPAKNPSFWTKRVDIEHQYVKIGSFWLPQTNHSVSSTRVGGKADLAINYGTYKVEPESHAAPSQDIPAHGGAH